MPFQIDQTFAEIKDHSVRRIERLLSTISLVEHDHAFVPKWSQTDFEDEANNLREALHNLYRTIRHEDVSDKDLADIDATLEQISVIYKPLLDQYTDYEKYHLLI